MKLNKSQKDAFVRGVLNDVPQEKYNEQALEIMQKAFVDAAPKAVQDIYNDPKTRPYLDQSYAAQGKFYGSFYCVGEPSVKLPDEVIEELKVLRSKLDDQQKTRLELRDALAAGISGCSTLKQAQEAFPELLKYLPEENVSTKNLPAIADVVNKLKDAGWKAAA